MRLHHTIPILIATLGWSSEVSENRDAPPGFATPPSEIVAGWTALSASRMYAWWYLHSSTDGSAIVGSQTLEREVDFSIEPTTVDTLSVVTSRDRLSLGLQIAADLGDDTAGDMKRLYGYISWAPSGTTAIRTIYETGHLSGRASWTSNAGVSSSQDVETRWQRYGIQGVSTNGAYAGLSYERMDTPYVIGFLDELNQLQYAEFVPDGRMQAVMLQVGGDHRLFLDQNPRRYLGFTGGFDTGLGYAWFSVPGSVINRAEATTGLSSDDDAGGILLAIDATAGLTWQQPWGAIASRVFVGGRLRYLYTNTYPLVDGKEPSADLGSLSIRTGWDQLMTGLVAEIAFAF